MKLSPPWCNSRSLSLGLGLLLLTSVAAACAPDLHSLPTDAAGPPKWTFENPNAERSAPTAALKSGPVTTSSLEALRSGQSTATLPSGPLKDIFFSFDSADLSVDARSALNANGNWLKNNPAARVQIEGHCDARGAAEYNLALGAKRAQATTDYLAALGISKERLSTISYGQEIPVCKESTEDCWAKNRRARFVIVSGKPVS